jgi:ABC-type lipoprotein export system ATPase subunit
MARAVYAAADVTLLDDPLSALDPAVARRVFEACLGPGSLLGSSTRVLVTHQRQYLPCCDR